MDERKHAQENQGSFESKSSKKPTLPSRIWVPINQQTPNRRSGDPVNFHAKFLRACAMKFAEGFGAPWSLI